MGRQSRQYFKLVALLLGVMALLLLARASNCGSDGTPRSHGNDLPGGHLAVNHPEGKAQRAQSVGVPGRQPPRFTQPAAPDLPPSWGKTWSKPVGFEAAIVGARHAIHRCYNDVLARDPEAKGTLNLRVVIARTADGRGKIHEATFDPPNLDGGVQKTSVPQTELASPALQKCILDALADTPMEPPAGGLDFEEHTYPLGFGGLNGKERERRARLGLLRSSTSSSNEAP